VDSPNQVSPESLLISTNLTEAERTIMLETFGGR
jgi:hypothetical protein